MKLFQRFTGTLTGRRAVTFPLSILLFGSLSKEKRRGPRLVTHTMSAYIYLSWINDRGKWGWQCLFFLFVVAPSSTYADLGPKPHPPSTTNFWPPFFVCGGGNPSFIVHGKLSDKQKQLLYLDEPTALVTRNCCFLIRVVCRQGSKLGYYKPKNNEGGKNKNPKCPLVTLYSRKYYLLSPDILEIPKSVALTFAARFMWHWFC